MASEAQLKKGLKRLLKMEGWDITRVAAETGASYFSVLNWKKDDHGISPAYRRILGMVLDREGVL